MRRFVLLFGLVAGCFMGSLAVAQETGWEGVDTCVYPETRALVDTLTLVAPVLIPIDSEGPSPFSISWHRATDLNFDGYYLYFFLEDPFASAIGDSWTLCSFFRAAPQKDHTSYNFAHLFTALGDEDGDRVLGLEGRIWVSLHKRTNAGQDITQITENSNTSIFLDTTDPIFESFGFSETSGEASHDLQATTSRDVLFSGLISGKYENLAGEEVIRRAACSDPLLSPRFRLYFDDPGEFIFESETENGIPYIDLDAEDGCTFNIPLTIPSGASYDRKYLTAHLRDLAYNESASVTISIDYFKSATAQAYPNPLLLQGGNSVTIQIEGAVNTNTPVRIFGPFGRVVKTLSFNAGDLSGGLARLTWDGTNGANQEVSTGVYLYVIETENGDNITGKIAVIK